MPRIASGTKDQISGTTGKIQVIADRVADKVLEATEWRPEAVRVVLKLKDNPEKEVSWPVEIESPDLRPYSTQVPQGEAALRRALAAIDTSVRWANVYNNFVQEWLCPPGKHVGILDDFHQFTRKRDGATRCSFRLVTKNGLTSGFTTPWPDIQYKKGEKPEDDWMGPTDELNEGTGPFPYLCVLGLDWKRWTDIELEQAVALWDGHFNEDLTPIKPYFASMDDLTPEIFAATCKHGLKPVQWEVVPHDDFVLSITRGQFFFELTPVIVEESQEDKAFQGARDVFLELWENFSRVLLDKPTLQFSAEDGKSTDEVKPVIKGVMVPIVREYPALVKLFRDGVPTISIPIKREDWRTNGLAVLSFVPERLMKEKEMFDIVNYETGAFGDSTALLAWAAENVPELADDMMVDEGEEF